MVSAPSLISSLPVYVPGKPIEAVAKEYGLDYHSIAKLASNENPLKFPKEVQTALQEPLQNLHVYPDGSSSELRNALAQKFGLTSDFVAVGNGSAELIEMAAKGFLGEGETAMFSQYSFAIYKVATLATNHRYQEIQASENFGHDLTKFLQSITEKTKIIFIANPNNPTGSMLNRKQLDAFVQAVPNDKLIVIDEAYYEYMCTPDYPDTMSYIKEQGRKNILILRTFSKIYGLAALRIGYGFAHPEVLQIIEKVRSPFNLNLLAQKAAVAALKCDYHVAASVAHASVERVWLIDKLKEFPFEVYGQGGNFLLIDVKRDGNFFFDELQKLGVIVRPLKGYGLQNFIRVSFGLRAENEKFVHAIRTIVNAYN